MPFQEYSSRSPNRGPPPWAPLSKESTTSTRPRARSASGSRGEDLSLTAFNGHTPGTLSVLFTDATSGKTTYAANRSLTVPAPGADGTVSLDFNRAVNLPCAYTDLATCPLPPAENRLPVAIEAGEQIPYERQDAS